MCVPRVPTRPNRVKPVQSRTPARARGSDAPADRPAARRARREDRQREEAHTDRWVAWTALEAHLERPGDAPASLYSLELGSSHTGGRRHRPRTRGLVLSDVQRERCRKMIAAVEACGTAFKAFRRFAPVATGWREERLVCQTLCGTRACARCDAAIRQRECWRVEGPWRQFITLGVPASGLSIRQAWYRIRRARALLFKRLERHVAQSDAWAVRVWPDDAQAARDHRARTAGSRKRASDLDYAWVLEPHKSGYPHLHIVTNTAMIDYAWLRRVWSACIGRAVQWIKVKPVKQEAGMVRYLSKYLSKSVFTLDLCALMYRQRMWATTRPLPPDAEQGWLEEPETTAAQAAREAQDPSAFDAREGWGTPEGSRGRYWLWSRTWPVEDHLDWWTILQHCAWRVDPARRKAAGRAPPSPSVRAYAAVADLWLEVAWLVMTGRWTLTEADKVCFTAASGS